MTYQFNTTASPFNDETYLEAFVESISTSLPNELKRNLDHLCDLDKTSAQLLEQWRDKQDNCVKQVEDSLVRKFRSDAAGIDTTTSSDTAVGTTNDTPTVLPATPSKLDCSQSPDNNQSPEKSPSLSDSPTKKKASACKKCRAKKTRCGVQPFCLNLAAGLDSSNSRQGSSPKKKQKLEEEPMPEVSQEELTAHLLKRGPPTSKEINSILSKHNPQYPTQRQEIAEMYNTLQQYSNEKMSTAHQVKSMIDMALGRIDRDLAMFERELKIGNSSSSGGVGGGMQGMMTSSGHQQQSAYHPQPLPTSSFAPVPSTTTSTAPSLHRSTGLPTPTSSCQQKKQQPSTQEVVEKSTVKSTNLAAIKVSPTSTEWILAKILSTENGMHTLSDEDVTSKQIYRLPVGRQVKILEDQKRHALWNRGDDCYAIYPETTSFYRATVSTPLHNGYVGVQFRNDMDANGITHEKAVQLGHIMKRPR